MIDLANLAKNSAVGIKRRMLRDQFELEIWHFVVLICVAQVPWEDLCYLLGEIMYGGHITDEWDRKLCCTYLQEFINPKMVKTFRALQYRLLQHITLLYHLIVFQIRIKHLLLSTAWL